MSKHDIASALKTLGQTFGLVAQRASIDEEIAAKIGFDAAFLTLKAERELEALRNQPTPVTEPGKIVQLPTAVKTPARLRIFDRPRLLNTAEMIATFGKPGDPKNLVRLDCPYPMRIAWDLKDTINDLLVHKKVAPYLHQVMTDLREHYGLPRIQELGIDLFGGMYNYRPQRGLEKKYAAALAAGNLALAMTYLSRHSWATAWDLDPARNQLKETSRTARFARAEYKPLIDIHYANGFISYGRERNNDWMHFELGVVV